MDWAGRQVQSFPKSSRGKEGAKDRPRIRNFRIRWAAERDVLLQLRVDSRRDAISQECADGIGKRVVLISRNHVRRARNFDECYVG